MARRASRANPSGGLLLRRYYASLPEWRSAAREEGLSLYQVDVLAAVRVLSMTRRLAGWRDITFEAVLDELGAGANYAFPAATGELVARGLLKRTRFGKMTPEGTHHAQLAYELEAEGEALLERVYARAIGRSVLGGFKMIPLLDRLRSVRVARTIHARAFYSKLPTITSEMTEVLYGLCRGAATRTRMAKELGLTRETLISRVRTLRRQKLVSERIVEREYGPEHLHVVTRKGRQALRWLEKRASVVAKVVENERRSRMLSDGKRDGPERRHMTIQRLAKVLEDS